MVEGNRLHITRVQPARAGAWTTTGTSASRLLTRLLGACLVVVLVAGCGGAEEREAKYLARGKALYEQGDFVKARLEFQNALQINPKDAEGLNYLGLIAESQGAWQDAFNNFKRVTEEKPDHAQAQLKLGNLFILAGETDKAAEQADIVEKLTPDDPDLSALRGAIALRRGDLVGAKIEAEEALARAPGHVGGTTVLASVYARSGQTDEAIAALDRAIATDPKNIALRMLKVRIFLDAKRPDAAAAVYQEVIALQPDEFAHRLALAQIRVSEDRLDDADAVLREAIAAGVGGVQPKLMRVELIERRDGAAAGEAELQRLIAAEPDEYAYRFRLADSYAKRGDPEDALATLKGVVDKDGLGPNGLGARVAMARLRLAKGEKEQGAALLEEVIAEDQGNADALALRAALAADAGDYDRAIGDLRRVLRDHPKSVPVLRMLAEAQLRKGDLELAMDSLKTLIEADPNDIDARRQLALLHARRGNAEAALALLDEVLAKRPDDVPALQARTELLIGRKSFREAQATAERLRAIAGQQAVGERLLGAVYQAQGQFDQAHAAYRRALAADPKSQDTVAAIVRADLAQEKPGEAITFLEQRIAADADDAFARNLLGEVLVREHKFEQADAAFRQAIGLRADWPVPYANRGQLFLAADKPQQAVAAYQEAVARFPEDQALALALAGAQERAGDPLAAIAVYDTLLAKNPRLDVAANNFGSLVADFQNDDKAQLKRALDLVKGFQASENPYFLDTLGWVYYRLADYAQARIYLERATTLLPENPQLQYHWGMTLHRLGETDRAREALQKAVSADAAYPGLDEAKRTLGS